MRRLLPALCLLCLSACGEVLYADVDEPEICRTFTGATVPGASADPAHELELALDYDFSEALSRYDLSTGQVELLGIRVDLTEGPSDLGFVDELGLRAGTEGQATVADYRREVANPGPELQIEGNGTDLFPYLRDGKLALQARVAGVLPQAEWRADFRACLRVHARVAYAGRE